MSLIDDLIFHAQQGDGTATVPLYRLVQIKLAILDKPEPVEEPHAVEVSAEETLSRRLTALELLANTRYENLLERIVDLECPDAENLGSDKEAEADALRQLSVFQLQTKKLQLCQSILMVLASTKDSE